jgi:hypothetical protein
VSRKDSYGVFYDPVPDDVPDYYEMIKRPMCFSDIKAKLESGKYRSPAPFQVPALPSQCFSRSARAAEQLLTYAQNDHHDVAGRNRRT